MKVRSLELRLSRPARRKRINRKLTQAANKDATAVLDLVSEELSLMNCVNMATALHRIARHSVGAPKS